MPSTIIIHNEVRRSVLKKCFDNSGNALLNRRDRISCSQIPHRHLSTCHRVYLRLRCEPIHGRSMPRQFRFIFLSVRSSRPLERLDVSSSKFPWVDEMIKCVLVLCHACFQGPMQVPLSNHAIDDDRLNNETHSIHQTATDKPLRSSPGTGETHVRQSPTGRNKRLLTKDIMSGELTETELLTIPVQRSTFETFAEFSSSLEAEHLVKHLHLSRQTDHESTSTFLFKSLTSPEGDSEEKSPKRPLAPDEILSIHERLYMNFTETCPLFLLKEGIDHRFEFFDFAPDLYVRQQFHPIDQDEGRTSNTENPLDPIHSTTASSTHLFSTNIQPAPNLPAEVE